MRALWLVALLGCGQQPAERPVAVTEAETEAEAETETEAEAETETEAEVEVETVTEAATETVTEAEAVAEAVTETEAETVTEADSEAVTRGGRRCPAGTCRRRANGPCERPTGQLGNGCCACGPDGMCSHPCRCASEDTLVETPAGPRPIADLRPGDLVYSVDGRRRVAVPILRTQRVPVRDHRLIRVRLRTGGVIEMSAEHPTGDGRTMGRLVAGDSLDGVEVVDARPVPYDGEATYDILPASSSGVYFVAGVRVGTTMTPE